MCGKYKKWIVLFATENKCRKIRADQIIEYSWEKIEGADPTDIPHRLPPKFKFMLHLSWDRATSGSTGMVREGDTIFFEDRKMLSDWIEKYLSNI